MATDDFPISVVIVGAGIAGLTAARELLDRHEQVEITIIEAEERCGGRILGHDRLGDVGAEFIHGTGTLLTALMDELMDQGIECLEKIFITSHADGGPDHSPTKAGHYGMFYIGGQLLACHDPSLSELHHALEQVISIPTEDRWVSVGAALDRYELSEDLEKLAVASFGNTAGCTDLHQLSLPMLQRFDRHWFENETEGDYRPPAKLGMSGIVDALVDELKPMDRLTIRLGCKVTKIRQNSASVQVTCESGEVIDVDAVIVTVPPPVLSALDMNLSADKHEALGFIGFARTIKVCIPLNQRLWPEKLQSIISADGFCPEIWFRELPKSKTRPEPVHLVVAYLVSSAADSFMEQLQVATGSVVDKATELVLQQLAEMLNVPFDEWRAAHVGDPLLFDWLTDAPTIQGGYMYPKVGLTQKHLETLAHPDGRIYFAGEAMNTGACCTIQAAMETAVRAVQDLLFKEWFNFKGRKSGS